MGYRPNENGGFTLTYGPFYTFCKKAEENPDEPHYFIIDEINRGNLSKIFGELLMLIEGDKRGEKNALRLLYEKDKLFFVPEKLYIIGMMNTADRSLAMLDYALRRRFAFFDMTPAFDSESFVDFKDNLNNAEYNKLVDSVKELNQAIASDSSLGPHFRIGHSYFCPKEDEKVDATWLSSIVEHELLPLITEYWFDEQGKVKEWEDKWAGMGFLTT